MGRTPAPEPLYVNFIESNIKSSTGGRWSTALSRLAFIHGPNTSGKTRVQQAIEAALVKSVDDINERDEVSANASLLELGDGASAYAGVTLSDGRTGSYFVQLVDGKVKDPSWTSPLDEAEQAACLPHRLVRAAVGAGTDKARKQFLSWAASGVSTEDVLARIPENLQERYREIAAPHAKLSPVDALFAVADYSRKRVQEARSELKGVESLATQADAFDAAPSKTELEEALDAVEAASGYLRDRELVADWQQASGEAQDAEQALAQAQARLGIGSSNEPPVSATKALTAYIDYGIASGGSCPCCGSMVGVEHLQQSKAFYENVLVSRAGEAEAEANAGFLTKRLNVAQARLRDLTAKLESREAAPDVDLEVLHRETLATLANLQAKSQTAGEGKRARDKAAELRVEIESTLRLTDACNDAVAFLLDKSRQTWIDRVQRYLPEEWVYAVELKDSRGKDVFRRGIMHNGAVRMALSGAESATVTVAEGCAVAEADAKGPPGGTGKLRVLFVDDKDFDPEHRAAVMRALSNFPGQVVMTGTSKPYGKFPAGWECIEASSLDTQAAESVAASEGGERKEALALMFSSLGVVEARAKYKELTGEAPKKGWGRKEMVEGVLAQDAEQESPPTLAPPTTRAAPMPASMPALLPAPTSTQVTLAPVAAPQPEVYKPAPWTADVLRAAGYQPDQIQRMNQGAVLRILNDNIPAAKASILANGDLVLIESGQDAELSAE